MRADRPSPLLWPGLLVGLGLGGFFDGILLHQVLQWHHLVSGWEEDLGRNVFWDGMFHAAMAFFLVLGLVLLLRVRRRAGEDRGFLAAVLMGAGAFHVLDGVVNHWLLGTHHIHPEGAVLLWDLSFFGAGVLLFVLGLALWRRVRA